MMTEIGYIMSLNNIAYKLMNTQNRRVNLKKLSFIVLEFKYHPLNLLDGIFKLDLKNPNTDSIISIALFYFQKGVNDTSFLAQDKFTNFSFIFVF